MPILSDAYYRGFGGGSNPFPVGSSEYNDFERGLSQFIKLKGYIPGSPPVALPYRQFGLLRKPKDEPQTTADTRNTYKSTKDGG